MAKIKIGDLYTAAVTARNYSEYMCQLGKWVGIPQTDDRVNDITLEDLVGQGNQANSKNTNCAIFDDSDNEVAVCPDCKSTNISKWSDGELTCYDCKKHWQTDC